MKAMFVVATALAALMSAPAAAVTVGQIDTFEGGLQGWFAGGGPFGGVPPVPPQVIADGGPQGAGDSFMLVTAGGGIGPGSRPVAMNASQWAGDYAASGVRAIAMDLRNLGTSDLTVRLFFENPIPGPPTAGAVTSFGAFLPAGGDWTHVVFPVAAPDFTALFGDLDALLAGTTLIRLFHSASPTFPGDPVAGELGVDNIAAVPEPTALASCLVALAALGAFGRRRRARRDD